MTLERLRERAAGHTLFTPLTLRAAVVRLGFVQADPIRAPARAQDLILHQRVVDYAAGDLERRYVRLGIEEDYLYAYGFMPRTVRRLLHPRVTRPLTKLESAVLAVLQERGPVHPATLEEHFGRTRAVNAWGGYSKASTRALDWLHYAGRIRVARRENGVRVYAVSPPAEAEMSPRERFERIVLIAADLLAPVPERTLAKLTAPMRRHFGAEADHRAAIAALVATGALRRDIVDGRTYLRPAGRRAAPPQARVRLLAPFDPVVWDRRRFEHLWGWTYRFEAYTPAAERVRGYYALPLLWRSSVIGWANVALAGSGLRVDLGFAGARPAERAFTVALEEELERMRSFLNAGCNARES